MKKLQFPIFLVIIFLSVHACKTDPIIPSGGIQPPPITQDPGTQNLCAEGIISFQYEVLPLMISGCAYTGCHDAASAEDGVVLDSYENVMKEVTPGDPNDSELYESITETEPDEIMPPRPHEPMSLQQIALVRNWILQGADNTDCGTVCDSSKATFTEDVFPVLKDYCIGCHNINFAEGGVALDTYQKIILYVNDGSLLGSVRHEPAFAVMPPVGSQLSDCRIAQIEKWIGQGAPEN